jgi:hypothetical protein
MRLTITTDLDRPRDVVWRAFDNPGNMRIWQPTLEEFEPVSGTPGQPGSVARLTYREGKSTIVLTETITARGEPDSFAGYYDSGHARNTVSNRFIDLGDGRTRWEMEGDFQFRGFFRLLAPLFRGMVQRRMVDDCRRFKTTLEEGRLST